VTSDLLGGLGRFGGLLFFSRLFRRFSSIFFGRFGSRFFGRFSGLFVSGLFVSGPFVSRFSGGFFHRLSLGTFHSRRSRGSTFLFFLGAHEVAELVLEKIAQLSRARAFFVDVRAEGALLVALDEALDRERDLPIDGVDGDDLGAVSLAWLDDLRGVLDALGGELGAR